MTDRPLTNSNGETLPIFRPEEAAAFGILIADVMDTYLEQKTSLAPVPIAGSTLSRFWTIDGTLVARDVLFKDDHTLDTDAENTVFYGYLAHRNGSDGQQEFVAIIRGTEGLKEWLIDAKADQERYSLDGCGEVEGGFYGVYRTMEFRPLLSPDRSGDSAWNGIVTFLKNSPRSRLVVTGHSLGAALATYLLFDLCRSGELENVTGCLFASPRPGNHEFAANFDQKVIQYDVYDYDRDIVPNLPPYFMGYVPLPRMAEINHATAKAEIADEVRANHHVLCYSAMLDFGAVSNLDEWRALLVRDQDDPDSILGPRRENAH
jgi:hypothetical protein